MVWDENGSHLGGGEWTGVMARRGGLPGVRLGPPGFETGVSQGMEEWVRPAFSRASIIPVGVMTPSCHSYGAISKFCSLLASFP